MSPLATDVWDGTKWALQNAGTDPEPEPVDTFVLGETKPDPTIGTGNVGLRVDEATLTPYSGDIHFTTNGQVIEGLDISGRVFFDSTSNTTLRNCLVRGGPTSAYGTQWTHISCYGEDGVNRLVEFCEIRPSNPTVDTYGISGWGFTLSRSVIKGCVDTVNAHRSPSGRVHSAKILGNYLETVWYAVDPRQTDGSHCDLWQIFSGSENVFEGNFGKGPNQKSNGVVFSPNSTTGAAQLKNTIIRKNWFQGCYTQISCWDANNTFDAVPGVVITGNRHGVGANSASGDHRWDILMTQENYNLAALISGNVRDPGGAAISPYINN